MAVAIIDSGGANIASLQFALQRLGQSSVLTTDATEIRAASRVILPGVGAARNAMSKLRDHRLLDVIRNLKQPVLGICLGMQLLAEASDEEDVDCLGIIPGTAARLPASPQFPVPNMGWCPILKTAEDSVLDGLNSGNYFYFVHSYALPVSQITLASAEHEHRFAAIVRQGNFLAAQFHPERSSAAGSRLLKNFLCWRP
ncbi:MAG: imidazole glycerol phosphate synthase subunit HisH [Gammaproteobacteria bacterium]|nr:imidazole glycerol phosphate synthase subunit HisH [Gammaproteobacteria bacterium]MDH5303045.1 imidazole glycerol phosphate synthase subunit HisH [Gammaproteobacteria bacterium]MDH5321207.1 imidazole glycerol phosphate synthase subunit HisH [Gammaproteobacteria bacterium]